MYTCICWKRKPIFKQDSPPTWTQEAYCPPCSKSLVGGTYLGQGGTHLCWGVPNLSRGYLPWPGGTYFGWGVPTLARVPFLTRGYLPWPEGTYLGQRVPTLARGVPTLAGGTCLSWRGGYLPRPGYFPGVDRQPPVETVPSPILRMRAEIIWQI